MSKEKAESKIDLRILQECSKYYLSQPYPDNWYELSQGEKEEYILANLTEEARGIEPKIVESGIESYAKKYQHDDMITNPKLGTTVDFRTLKLCSGHYLTKPYPDNWESMSKENQILFIKNNSWGGIVEETFTPEDIFKIINNAALLTQMLIDKFVAEAITKRQL